MRRNMELKARYPDLERAARIVESLGAEFGGTLRHHDTYFHSRNGRLKLRQTDSHEEGQLIWYEREDTPGIAPCTYLVTVIREPQMLKEALHRSVGILAEVRKAREPYVWENVRIHLDDVEGVGRFIGLQVVLFEGINDAEGRRKLENLCHHLQIEPSAYVAESYATLINARR